MRTGLFEHVWCGALSRSYDMICYMLTMRPPHRNCRNTRTDTHTIYIFSVNKHFCVRSSHQSLTASLSIVCVYRERTRHRRRAENWTKKSTQKIRKFCKRETTRTEVKLNSLRRVVVDVHDFLLSLSRTRLNSMLALTARVIHRNSHFPLWSTQSNGICNCYVRWWPVFSQCFAYFFRFSSFVVCFRLLILFACVQQLIM